VVCGCGRAHPGDTVAIFNDVGLMMQAAEQNLGLGSAENYWLPMRFVMGGCLSCLRSQSPTNRHIPIILRTRPACAIGRR